VILSKNEWKEAGLCNGIQGKVVRIVYHPVEGNKPGALPVLLVQWGEGYIGPSFLPWLDRVTPVTKIRDPHKKNKGVTRTGLPIALAFGISVGKTQGMTSVEGLTVSFGRSAGRYKGCSEYIMMSRARRHGRGGLLIRHPFNYGRFCLRDDFTGGSIMNRARNYASRRRCLDREVERCKETLKRNQTVVECIMKKRGEVGGVHAKMEEVRVWHAQQRMLCGGDDLGTKGVYYMYMRRDDITLVARGGANGRQKSVVLSRSDKKVLYRVRPPTTAEARKESSRLLKEEEDIDYDFLPEFPLSILKKGDLILFIRSTPYAGASVLCDCDAKSEYSDVIADDVWSRANPMHESGALAKEWHFHTNEFGCRDCTLASNTQRGMLRRSSRLKELGASELDVKMVWVRFRQIDTPCPVNLGVYECPRPHCFRRFDSTARLSEHLESCTHTVPGDADSPAQSGLAPRSSGFRMPPDRPLESGMAAVAGGAVRGMQPRFVRLCGCGVCS
jgi:hypothetical protein